MIGVCNAAVISPCGLYRYTLHRRIPSALRWMRPCLFVMLNPSIADATRDDPTIRRCISFANREGCTALTVVNLFALRATDPAELAKHDDPFGPDNHLHLRAQFDAHRTGLIVAAWGAHPMAHDIGNADVFSELCSLRALCLGMTKHGSPRHPLYVKSDQPLIPWTGRPG